MYKLQQKILLFLCLFVCHNFASAKDIISAQYFTDINHLIITPHVSVFRSDSVVSISDVNSAGYQGKFNLAPDKPVVFCEYDPFIYWFRIIIMNEGTSPRDLMLLMAPVGMRDGQLYQRNGKNWNIVGQTGYQYRFLDRPYQYANYVFPITVAPGIVDTLYLRMDATYSFKSYGFALMAPKALKVLENQVYFSFGIIVGLLLLFCLFNVYLYVTSKDKIHLWYALYVGMLILIVMKNDQLDQEFFHWDSESAYKSTSILGIGAVGMAILMHVIQKFLVDISRRNILHKISFATKAIAFAAGTAQIATFYLRPGYHIQNMVFIWARASTFLVIFIIVVDCIYSLIRGNKSTYFILAGLLVFLIGVVQRLLLVGTSSYFFPPYIFHIGMVMESVIISFGLIYRYRLDKKEKLRNLREKQDLRNSMDKILLESKIEIQQQTLKTSFREIDINVRQSINLMLDHLRCLKTAPPESRQLYLVKSTELLSNTISDLRNLCKTLDTDFIREMGLCRLIEYEFEQKQKTGDCNLQLKISGEPKMMDPKRELILYRIYQELLNIINEQASATSISVQLNYEPLLFKLIVAFNSSQLNTEAIKRTIEKDVFGKTDIQNRASLIDASFSIESKLSVTRFILIMSSSEPARVAQL